MNFHRRGPRPWPERQNEDDRKKFQEELRGLASDPRVELWSGDESGFEGDPQPRRHHFELKFLPGYSPDFNPIERRWLCLKADWFWDFIARTPQELSDRLCRAVQSFVHDPTKTASNCSLRK